MEYMQQKNKTFDNLLGTGVVHLLLDCVWGQDSVKHIGLALQEEEQNTNHSIKQIEQKRRSVMQFHWLENGNILSIFRH